MRVLVALDKFKDSMSAETACGYVASVMAGMRGGWTIDACPLSDGGEGFSSILTKAAGGGEHSVVVTGPRGGKVQATVGLVMLARIPPAALAVLGEPPGTKSGYAAVIDMASASGLALLDLGNRDLMRASSRGTGELLLAAGRMGAHFIILGVGGSATHDLGLGALGAMGLGFEGNAREPLDPLVPADWGRLRAIRGAIPKPFPPILIACDVSNPLLGPRGALTVYGPQKGLRPADLPALEAATASVASLLCRHFGIGEHLAAAPGSGAAGGIAFGLMAAAGARIVPGFKLVSAWAGLEERISAADMVVTGEGRFDESSLEGKGPGSVARRALEQGKIVHVFAGQVALTRPIPGLCAHEISPRTMEFGAALAEAPALLCDSVRRAFRDG
jgi:glycerate kinase